MLVGMLLANCYNNTRYILSDKIASLFNSIYFYTIYMLSVSMFLFFGAYIGYFTAYKDTISFSPKGLIKIAEESKVTGNCSQIIYDYGKGGIQFSQRYNGFNNYFKDQVMLFGDMNKSDSMVLKWYMCAADEIIIANKASLELMNVHVNVISTISVLPGKLGDQTRLNTKKYINLWEERLMQLMSLAPKRVDQATPLISYYLNNKNDDGVKRICSFFDDTRTYQGFCDLALGAIYIKEGNFNEGIYLIKRANKNGVLDSKDVDKDTAKYLKSIITKYD
jgi:hypothetical protein